MRAPKAQTSKLAEAAERGAESILTVGDVAEAGGAVTEPIGGKPFRYGILAGLLSGPIPDFEPMTDQELDQLEREKEERTRQL